MARIPPKVWLLLVGMLLVGSVAVLALLTIGPERFLGVLGELWLGLKTWLSTIPLWLFWLAFMVLPCFGVPLTLLYIVAAAVAGDVRVACAISLSALFINQWISYGLAAGPLHHIASLLLKRWNIAIPRLPTGQEGRYILTVRLSPLPYALQNYALGLTRCGWQKYMLFSFPPMAVIGVCFLFLGSSILNGGLGAAMLGLFLILAVSLGAQAWVKRNRTSAVDTPKT